jgi:D-ribose pyranase
MLKSGILNPQISALLARVRHTNTLVIADKGFPFWSEIETIDISLVDNVPTVIDVLRAVRESFLVGKAYMAEEFRTANDARAQGAFAAALEGVAVTYEPHVQLKRRVPAALGLIRTGDATPFGNVVIESV